MTYFSEKACVYTSRSLFQLQIIILILNFKTNLKRASHQHSNSSFQFWQQNEKKNFNLISISKQQSASLQEARLQAKQLKKKSRSLVKKS